MDACRGHSSEALIGSNHLFFQEKTSFPNSPPVEYFGFSLRKWKCSYSNLGNSSFPQIKKKQEFFSQIFVIYITSTVGKLGFSEAVVIELSRGTIGLTPAKPRVPPPTVPLIKHLNPVPKP